MRLPLLAPGSAKPQGQPMVLLPSGSLRGKRAKRQHVPAWCSRLLRQAAFACAGPTPDALLMPVLALPRPASRNVKTRLRRRSVAKRGEADSPEGTVSPAWPEHEPNCLLCPPFPSSLSLWEPSQSWVLSCSYSVLAANSPPLWSPCPAPSTGWVPWPA